jgi:hypothetical protein
MFTEDQLKQLRQVIREEVEEEAEKTRHSGAAERLYLKGDLREIKDGLKDVEIRTKSIEQMLDKEIQSIAVMFNKTWEKMESNREEDKELAERVTALEEHTGLAKHN